MELVHTSTELNEALTKAKFYNGNNIPVNTILALLAIAGIIIWTLKT